METRTTVRRYLLHSFLSRLYFFIPILVLWFLKQGFQQFEVTLLLSVFFLSTTLAEIPTGIFSDRYGHRRGIAFCGLFQAAGIFILAFASSLPIALLGEALMGIGQAFYTGAKEAFLFNLLEDSHSADLYQRDYAHAKFFEFVAMGLASLVGGTVYAYWPELPFFLSTGAFLLAAIVGLSLPEPHRREARESASSFRDLDRGMREILQGPATLRSSVAYYCLFFTVILIFIVTLAQPTLREAGIPIPYFGIIFFLFQSASMGGSLWARRFSVRRIHKHFFPLLAFATALFLIGLSFFKNPSILLLVVGIYFAWGLFLPTISHTINHLISSSKRATVLSTQDFLQHLLFVILAPLLGWLTDLYGLSASLGGLSLLAVAAALLLRLNRNFL